MGNSGSGKSTLARALAVALDAPYLELDSLYHQADWQPADPAVFAAQADTFTSGDTWVVDGNYRAVRATVWSRADTVIWLDLPRRTVMRQIVLRTLRRATLRQELWNGNREPLRNFFSTDPERSVIAWSWQKHAEYRAQYTTAAQDPAWAHLTFIRVRSRRQAARLIRDSRSDRRLPSE